MVASNSIRLLYRWLFLLCIIATPASCSSIDDDHSDRPSTVIYLGHLVVEKKSDFNSNKIEYYPTDIRELCPSAIIDCIKSADRVTLVVLPEQIGTSEVFHGWEKHNFQHGNSRSITLSRIQRDKVKNIVLATDSWDVSFGNHIMSETEFYYILKFESVHDTVELFLTSAGVQRWNAVWKGHRDNTGVHNLSDRAKSEVFKIVSDLETK